MVFQKKTINNVPTLVPLTADTGSGAPLGTIHGFYKKGNYAGYLYLDGSTFDETLYPALYAYLGTNVLPDYREFVLVGAEQNTNSTVIATHDVFTQGQEKDDQLQDHEHQLNLLGSISHIGQSTSDGTYGNYKSGGSDIVNEIRAKDIPVGRHGTTTRTKEKAVFWYIKATTGISEREATDVLNVMNERFVAKSDISYLSRDKLIYHQETGDAVLYAAGQSWGLLTGNTYTVHITAVDKNSITDNYDGIVKFTYGGFNSITNISHTKLSGSGSIVADNTYGTLGFSFDSGLVEICVTLIG